MKSMNLDMNTGEQIITTTIEQQQEPPLQPAADSESMVTLTDQDECEFLKRELQHLIEHVQGGFRVFEETYFYLEHE